jgi:hypothetical protein
MNRENLAKLEALLIADAGNKNGIRFNINDVGTIRQDPLWRKVTLSTRPVLSCRTSGCAMGLAAMSGQFDRLGYTVGRSGWVAIRLDGAEQTYSFAAMQIFDIDYPTARFLFSPDYYPSELEEGAAGELEVARRIRVLLDTGKLTREDLRRM